MLGSIWADPIALKLILMLCFSKMHPHRQRSTSALAHGSKGMYYQLHSVLVLHQHGLEEALYQKDYRETERATPSLLFSTSHTALTTLLFSSEVEDGGGGTEGSLGG